MRDGGEKYSDSECSSKECEDKLNEDFEKKRNPKMSLSIWLERLEKMEMPFTEMGNLWEDHLGT